VLRVVTLDPAVEDRLIAGIHYGERGLEIQIPPDIRDGVVQGVAEMTEQLTHLGYHPVVLVPAKIRAALRQLTATRLPRVAVLSLNEITRDTRVESAGQVHLELTPEMPVGELISS
jgi:flagellar biosynthesis protein FlhA